MSTTETTVYYSPIEEAINVYSHAVGFILSVFATIFLLLQALEYGGGLHIFSFTLFGVSLMTLYAASTIYHKAIKPKSRQLLRVFDHSAIYILIAGTYAPFTLVTLNGLTGWIIFATSCAMATVGIILKLFFTGKYDLLSTLMYVFMGWLIIFAIKPLIENLHPDGLLWLVLGGVSYTFGAVIYSIKKIKFNHAIFHLFVLLGSICHFVSIYNYVLPAAKL